MQLKNFIMRTFSLFPLLQWPFQIRMDYSILNNIAIGIEKFKILKNTKENGKGNMLYCLLKIHEHFTSSNF